MSRLTHAGLFDPGQFSAIGPDHNKALKTFQSALNFGKTVLAEYHLEGGSAVTLGNQRSWLLDQVLIQCWQRFFPENSHQNPTIVASGSYG